MSPDQEEAYDIFKSGRNLFLTGPGGTGKSHLIRHMQQSARNRALHVCAMTGTAAQLLECKATTLHKFAGIGLGKDMFERATEHFRTVKRWRKAEVLIVDEVSMMSRFMFEELDRIAKHNRKSALPFGGIQLVFCGDFYQLPPVGDVEFCFESPLWDPTFPEQMSLVTMHRQKNAGFCKILQEIRCGKLSKASFDQLNKLVGPSNGAVRLVPTCAKADAINLGAYALLSGEEHVYKPRDILDHEMTPKKTHARHRFSEGQVHAELARLRRRFEDGLKLKVGARVMCTYNLDDVTCNGSQGVVTRFVSGHPMVQFKTVERLMWQCVVESDEIPGVAVSQVPLMYAWAITIHKAQGASLESAEIDIGSGVFEAGQTYVALSRLRDMENLCITSFDASKIRMSVKAREFYKAFE